MGMVIWFKRQDDPTGDDDDRPYLLREMDFLDALANESGVRAISDFFDYADANASLMDDESDDEGVESVEAWHEPSSLLKTLEALHARLSDAAPPGDPATRGALLEEVQGCIAKTRSAAEDGAKVHLCVVM